MREIDERVNVHVTHTHTLYWNKRVYVITNTNVEIAKSDKNCTSPFYPHLSIIYRAYFSNNRKMIGLPRKELIAQYTRSSHYAVYIRDRYAIASRNYLFRERARQIADVSKYESHGGLQAIKISGRAPRDIWRVCTANR